MRNYFGGSFAAILLAVLVACGSTSPKPQSSNTAPNPSPTASPAPTTPTASPSPTSNPAPAPAPAPMPVSPSPTPIGGTPAPSPAPPTPPAPAQSATYVYARASGGVLGYRLNSDGSLTAIPGSPFSIAGTMIAAGGAHLFSAAQSQILVYGIDPVTGAVTSQSQAAVPGAGQIAAVNGLVYVTGTNSAGDFAIYGFSVGTNGALAPLPGSPFFLSGVCDLCVTPESIAADAKYVAVGEGGGPHSAGGFILFARGADGSLQRTSGFGGSSVVSLALNQPGTVAYAIQSSDSAILVESIDAAGQLHQIQYEYQPDFFLAMDLDPAGPYLVATTSPNGLVSYQLAADGGLAKRASSLPVSPSSAASTAVFDSSGRFIVLVQAGGLSVYAFNQATGSMNQTGSAAASSALGRAVVVTF